MVKPIRLIGLLAIIVYVAFTFASYTYYPVSYTPLRNWLSDLGNPLVNPNGAVLYNAGCISTALLLMVFYVGMNAWRTGDRVLGRLLSVGQISGAIASAALILAAVLNIGTHALLHSRCSMILTIGLTWFLSFANTALMRHPGFRKWIGIYGFAAAAATLVYGVFFNRPAGEWIAIGTFVIYISLLCVVPPTRASAGLHQRAG